MEASLHGNISEWTKIICQNFSFTFIPELWHYYRETIQFATHLFCEAHGQRGSIVDDLYHTIVTVQVYVIVDALVTD